MTPYNQKYSDIANYIKNAHGWLEDAESALQVWLDRAEPMSEEAFDYEADVRDAHGKLKAYIRRWESTFCELTAGLPDDGWDEDDHGEGGVYDIR